MLTFSSLNGQNLNANQIINASIASHGGDHYKNAHFAFDFRKYHYEYHYDHGRYSYQRHAEDGATRDNLTNDGFTRTVNGELVDLTDKKRKSYSNSVNSVHYFAFLPFFLNDAAVNKNLLGTTTVKGKAYYKIQVTFDQEGGGDDYDDIYVYWIDKVDYSLDYLAYSFHVNGGGVRFRAAYNQRKVGGIVFQDYVNYKYEKETPVANLDTLYENDQLVELSRIELKNIRVL